MMTNVKNYRDVPGCHTTSLNTKKMDLGMADPAFAPLSHYAVDAEKRCFHVPDRASMPTSHWETQAEAEAVAWMRRTMSLNVLESAKYDTELYTWLIGNLLTSRTLDASRQSQLHREIEHRLRERSHTRSSMDVYLDVSVPTIQRNSQAALHTLSA